jgi:hypothetical protein
VYTLNRCMYPSHGHTHAHLYLSCTLTHVCTFGTWIHITCIHVHVCIYTHVCNTCICCTCSCTHVHPSCTRTSPHVPFPWSPCEHTFIQQTSQVLTSAPGGLEFDIFLGLVIIGCSMTTCHMRDWKAEWMLHFGVPGVQENETLVCPCGLSTSLGGWECGGHSQASRQAGGYT